MPRLSDIVKKVENDYQIQLKGDYYPNSFIKSVRFLSYNDVLTTHLPPNVLYLADYSKYPDAEVFGIILYTNCQNEVKGENIIATDKNISLLNIYNTISDVLEKNNIIEQNKKDLYLLLHEENSIDGLLKKASQFLNLPLLIIDSSFSLISYSTTYDSKLVFEEKDNRITMKEKFIDKIKQDRFFERLYHAVYPFKAKLPFEDYIGVFASIRIANSVIGYLYVKTDTRDLTYDEMEYVHDLSKAVSIQLQKNNTYQNPLSIHTDIFFNDLLLNHFKKESDITASLKDLDVVIKQFYFFIASSFIDRNNKRLNDNYYISTFNQTLENSVTILKENYYITLVSTSSFKEYINSYEGRLEPFLKMNNMIAAISYPFTSLMEASIYAYQSSSLLKHCLSEHNDKTLNFYNDFFFEHLTFVSNHQKEIEASINPQIKEMIKYDKNNKTEYTKTLIAYLKNNRDAPLTAKALFIHKSTLFYRFGKMEQLFSINFNSANDLFAYEYSFRVLNLIK